MRINLRAHHNIQFWIMISLTFFFLGCKQEKQKKDPNVIYILEDDLGYGDLSSYNSESKISTPYLDQLAREGMRFTDMHSTSSVCTPTRYSILTGEYAWRTPLKKGVLWSYGPLMIADDQETLPKLFKRRDYQTAVIGKWHLGLDWVLKTPYDSSQVNKNKFGLIIDYNENVIDFSKAPLRGPYNVGFDYSYIIPASLDIPPYGYLENEKFTQEITDYTPGSNLDADYDGAFWRPGPMAKGFDFYEVLPSFISKAKAFINKAKDDTTPFFLYLPLAAPHTPWVPKKQKQGISEAGMYGDFVSMVDHQVGQLISYIDELGLKEETLIVFASDNGPYWKEKYIKTYRHKAAGNLKGMKGDIYEGGHRIPFIVRWPGKIEAGSKSDNPNTLANFYATMAEYFGTSSKAVDSYSIFKELVERNHVPKVNAIVHHSSNGHFALRKGKWKLIEKLGSGGFSRPSSVKTAAGTAQERLFNLENDLAEAVDLSKEEPQKLERLKRTLDSLKSLK